MGYVVTYNMSWHNSPRHMTWKMLYRGIPNIHTHKYTHAHKHTHTHTHTDTDTHTRRTETQTQIHVHMCTHRHRHTHIIMHTHIYVYTIHMLNSTDLSWQKTPIILASDMFFNHIPITDGISCFAHGVQNTQHSPTTRHSKQLNQHTSLIIT